MLEPLYWTNHHSDRFCCRPEQRGNLNRLIQFVIETRHEMIEFSRVSEIENFSISVIIKSKNYITFAWRIFRTWGNLVFENIKRENHKLYTEET